MVGKGTMRKTVRQLAKLGTLLCRKKSVVELEADRKLDRVYEENRHIAAKVVVK